MSDPWRLRATRAFGALLRRSGLMLLLLLSACTGRRETPAPPATPTRIISCAPNLTEMLFALGAGPRLVGVTRYCHFPPEARNLPPLGDLYSPSLEAMVAARADLIVLAPGNRKVMEFFAAHPGPRLLEVSACETIVEIEETLRRLGAAVGAAGRADSLVRGIEAGLDSVCREYAGAPRVRYLLVLGHDEGALEQIYVTGQPTYLTELLALAGGDNVVAAELGRYPIVSREALVAMNPEVIIERRLGDGDGPDARRRTLALWSAMPALEAVRRGLVMTLDDDHVTINGPDLVRSARVLGSILHATP